VESTVGRFLNKQLVRETTSGRLDRAAELLDRGADLNRLDGDGMTPLMRASRYGHVELVRVLLGRGAEVNRTATDGAGALFWACVHGHLDVVEELLAAGAEVDAARGDAGNRNVVANHRYSPLNAAISNGHIAIAKRLVLAGAALDHRWLGEDIAEFAERNGATEFLVFLKKEWRLTPRRTGRHMKP
jgi:ankyrin repeat protein